MDEKFLDKNLKADKSLYEYVCLPLRITLGCLFLANVIPHKFYIFFAILFVITGFGFAYKRHISGNSWKNYSRAIITYLLVSGLLFWSMHKGQNSDTQTNTIVGLLLIFDALSGMQTKFIFNKLS